MKSKKAVIDQLFPLILGLVTIGIILVIGFLILAEGKSQIEKVQGLNSTGGRATDLAGTTAWNATVDTVGALADIPTWLPIIVITVIGALLIGLVSLFGKSAR
ncbi:hypothetical protein LCGC14_0884860 [marine sediment metagenome]|uniref:PDGLE domain-containing protein n=1 Tax=marine sediment metagenome TaxID=412755 RepID=A0A0F9P5V0_9ZZZZ